MVLKRKTPKERMKALEKTFKGISEIGDGIDALRKGVLDLKTQKGLGKKVHDDVKKDLKELEKTWSGILKKFEKFGI